MRYERKYEFPLGYQNLIKVFLLTNRFKEIYELRRVNSLYYDDSKYSLYYESLNGLSERQKIRARFYNSDNLNFNLEKKIKFEDLNIKTTEKDNIGNLIPLVGRPINNNFKIPANVYSKFQPKVFVTYIRRYFLSPDSKVRVTIDQNIDCYKVKIIRNKIQIGIKRQINNGILELKYSKGTYLKESFIQKLSDNFNLILSRSSKYCQSIDLLF